MTREERALAEAAFVADELRLFLDTHPRDQRALADYRAAAEQARQKKAELGYAISAMDAGRTGQWDWTQTPWPWEKEG